jgi:hypothetical protein
LQRRVKLMLEDGQSKLCIKIKQTLKDMMSADSEHYLVHQGSSSQALPSSAPRTKTMESLISLKDT